MGKGGWYALVRKDLPWKKLRRYEFTNLLFELIAAYFILKYTEHLQNPVIGAVLWVIVIGSALFCVMWACKQ